ncbi:unnamed protein product [Ceratitis capitata]|uniref:(Mediterranean fruit fly) hypothetical protein n=1 Tax=Ceratitis capitata TaxID=7213 RepID=A0A811UYE9_CERCA|nr:unnamed protein product [Ceratitis capitata]
MYGSITVICGAQQSLMATFIANCHTTTIHDCQQQMAKLKQFALISKVRILYFCAHQSKSSPTFDDVTNFIRPTKNTKTVQSVAPAVAAVAAKK